MAFNFVMCHFIINFITKILNMGKLIVFVPIAVLLFTAIAIWRWIVSDRRNKRNNFDNFV